MNASERVEFIARYRDGYRVVMESIDGLTEDDWDATEEGEWSPREIVHHLADAEMIGAIRIRHLLAEADAKIHGYDEKAFARLAMRRPVEPSLLALRGARESTVQLLERMTDDDWTHAGTHDERGRYTAEDWLTTYAGHAHDHADQIRRARGIS